MNIWGGEASNLVRCSGCSHPSEHVVIGRIVSSHLVDGKRRHYFRVVAQHMMKRMHSAGATLCASSVEGGVLDFSFLTRRGLFTPVDGWRWRFVRSFLAKSH